MSLVPYASSDVSDSEEENENSSEDSTLNENTVSSKQSIIVDSKDKNSDTKCSVLNKHSNHDEDNSVQTDLFNNELFKALPTPIETDLTPMSEEFDEFLHKKEVPVPKPTIKITVPTLKDFNVDSEEPQIKKFKSSTKTTGLFSILPPPRSSSFVSQKLVPRTVSQQTKKLIPDKVLKPPVVKAIDKNSLSKPSIHKEKEIIEDDMVEGNDFFSLASDTQEEIDESPQSRSNVVKELTTDIIPVPQVEEPVVFSTTNDFIPLTTEISENSADLGLDEEALRALCGARGVKQRRETQILELHESEVRPASSEWMQQALLKGTDNEPPAPTNALPGGMQRRKHQITFLAQQAKANEQQLKNMWAQNRFTRQQTQSKYGF